MPFDLRRLLACGASTVFAAAASLSFAQAPAPGMEKAADFRVLIDEQGKLKSATPLDASLGENILRAIVGAAKGVTFQPAMRDGQPANFESQLHVSVRFVAQADGSYKVELVSASLSPQAIERKPPIQPRGIDPHKLGAYVVASAVVGSDGRVDPSRIKLLKSLSIPGGEKDLGRIEQAVLTALAGSSYSPDLVGGKPVATEVLQTFRFCVEDCTQPAEPDLSAEHKSLPRIVDADAQPAHVPASLAGHAAAGRGKPLRFRIAIDAAGTVTSATPLGEGDATLVEATRLGLRGVHFFPATVQGRAVSSEMPVSVPVRVENGVAQAQFDSLEFDVSLLSLPGPRLHLGMRQGEVHARLHIVTSGDGRADASASGVDSLEILPASSPALKHSVQKEFDETIRLTRVEPVQVDGKGIALEFWRSYYSTFCEGRGSCDPPQGAAPPKDPPMKLPPGIELARVKP